MRIRSSPEFEEPVLRENRIYLAELANASKRSVEYGWECRIRILQTVVPRGQVVYLVQDQYWKVTGLCKGL